MSYTDRAQIILIAMIPLSVFTGDMYLCSLKDIGIHFGASPVTLQFTFSIYLIGMAFFTLSSAPFIERFGAKKVLLASLVSYLFGTLLSLLTHSMTLFIVGRFLQSFGGACTTVTTRSLASKNPITLTYMFLATSVSILAAPLLGSYLHGTFGWQANFVFLTALGSSLFSCTLLLEEKKEPITHTLSQEIQFLASSRQYCLYTPLVIIAWCGLVSFISGSPFFLLYYCKSSPTNFAILYSLAMTGFISGTCLSRKFRAIFPLGLTAICTGSALLLTVALLPLKALFIAASFVYLLGIGLILPRMQLKAIEDLTKSHYAFGIMYFLMLALSALCGLCISRCSFITGAASIAMALIGFFLAAAVLFRKPYFFAAEAESF